MWKGANGVGRSRMKARPRDVGDTDVALTCVKLLERFRNVGLAARFGSPRDAHERHETSLHPGDHLLATFRVEVMRFRQQRRGRRRGRVRVDA